MLSQLQHHHDIFILKSNLTNLREVSQAEVSFENVLALLVIGVLVVTGGGGESQDNQQDCSGGGK